MKKTLIFALSIGVFIACQRETDPNPEVVANAPDENYNKLFAISDGVVGGNLAHSVALPDGRSIWLYADSFVGKTNVDRSTTAEMVTNLKNSASIQNKQSFLLLNEVIQSKPKNIIEASSGSTSLIAHGAVVGGNLDLFVHEYSVLQRFSKMSIVRYSFPALKQTQVLSLKNSNNITYGDYVYTDTQHHYIFGREFSGANIRVHVARAPLGTMSTQATWKYFDGLTFVDSPADTKSILTISGLQFSVVKDGDKFKLIYQKGADVKAHAAPSVTGPFDAGKTLFTINEGKQTGNAFVHSQSVSPAGQYLISYDVLDPGIKNEKFYKNADNYRPKFYRHNLD